MSRTRKILLLALTLTVLGGLAFASTQSSYLKGVWDPTGENGGDVGGRDIATFETMDGGSGKTDGGVDFGDDDDDDDWKYDDPTGYLPVPGGGGGGGGADDDDDDPTWVIYLKVLDYNGNFMTGLEESNFTSATSFTSFSEASSYYYIKMPADESYTISVSKDGYIKTSDAFRPIEVGVDATVYEEIELPYSHVITVVDENGASVTGATVKAGLTSTSLSICYNYDDNEYGCPVLASSTNKGQYTVEKSGYDDASGTFAYYYTSVGTSSIPAEVILTEESTDPDPIWGIYLKVVGSHGDFIVGLEESAFTSATSFTSFTEEIDYYYITMPADGSYSISVSKEGYLTTSDTFSPLEVGVETTSYEEIELPYSHVVTVTDESGAEITGATVKAGLSSDSLVTCYNYSDNKYGCPVVASYTEYAQYTVESSGYEAESGRFSAYSVSTNHSSTTASVILALEAPAESTTSFSCTSLTLSSSDSELDADVSSQNVNLSVTISFDTLIAMWQKPLFDMVTLASTETWTDQLVLDSDGDGEFEEDSTGETGEPIYVDVSTSDGTDLTFDFTYTDAEDGDTLTASLQSTGTNACEDTLTITQAASAADDDDDDDDNTASVTADDDDDDDTYVTTLDTILRSESYNCEDDFTDTTGLWSEDIVCRMFNAEIVEGFDPPYTFNTEGDVTNAEVTKMIVGLLVEKDESDASGLTEGFTDVSDSDWYSDWYKIAEDEDIVRTRDAGGLASPQASCSRGQLAVYIARALGLTTYSYTIDFTDVDHDDWDAYAIALLSDEDTGTDVPYDDTSDLIPVIEGYSDDTFRPTISVSRDEALTMIYRAYLFYK